MEQKLQEIVRLLTDTNNLMKYGSAILQIIIILVAIKVVNHLCRVVINHFVDKQKKSRFGFSERKADTMGAILKSVTRYTLYIIGILSILDTLGIQMRTLLVGAGLGGVAIGLGAQSLIKDVISGFFILFEDQFSVGEYVTIDDMSGVVESIGLRITKLKDFSGDLHIIPNGSITKVTNHSRDNSRAMVDVEAGLDISVSRILDVLDRICESMKKENKDIVEGPSVLGVTELGDKGIKVRVVARTLPMKQAGVEMELRKLVKEEFDKEKISIPHPMSVIITKSGNN